MLQNTISYKMQHYFIYYWERLQLKVHLNFGGTKTWKMGGQLAGSVGRAYDSWSQGYKFELHIRYRDYLKNKILWEYLGGSVG